MQLASFDRFPIKIQLEEDIADTLIEDEHTKITGRIDTLAVNKAKRTTHKTYFPVLVIESKNSSVAKLDKLAQLLTYAYEGLENQASVWQLSTNGQSSQFVNILIGKSPIYQLMPKLSLIETEYAIAILQVLTAA